jgi:hypothetical protein
MTEELDTSLSEQNTIQRSELTPASKGISKTEQSRRYEGLVYLKGKKVDPNGEKNRGEIPRPPLPDLHSLTPDSLHAATSDSIHLSIHSPYTTVRYEILTTLYSQPEANL